MNHRNRGHLESLDVCIQYLAIGTAKLNRRFNFQLELRVRPLHVFADEDDDTAVVRNLKASLDIREEEHAVNRTSIRVCLGD